MNSEFNYVNIVAEGCEGWLNLFFGDECIACVYNVELANRIRESTPKRLYQEVEEIFPGTTSALNKLSINRREL